MFFSCFWVIDYASRGTNCLKNKQAENSQSPRPSILKKQRILNMRRKSIVKIFVEFTNQQMAKNRPICLKTNFSPHQIIKTFFKQI